MPSDFGLMTTVDIAFISFVFHFSMLAISNGNQNPATAIPLTATLTHACDAFGQTIPMEMAKVSFRTNHSSPIWVYGTSKECYRCLNLPLSLHALNASRSICVLLDTRWPYSIGYSLQSPFEGCSQANDTSNTTCAWQPNQWLIAPSSCHYGEHYKYSIHVTMAEEHAPATDVQTLQTAPNKHIPLYIAFAVCVLLIIACNLIQTCISKRCVADNNAAHFIDEKAKSPPKQRQKRLLSLDVFRGLSLSIMIFVNYGGGGYWWLQHSKWNGLTVADLVFPWFLFIMGTAMAIVLPRKLRRYHEMQSPLAVNERHSPAVSKWSIFKQVFIRGAKLGFIGLLIINHAFDLESLRMPGVLQYFAVAYVMNACIVLGTEPQERHINAASPNISNLFMPEIVLFWKQWLIVLCILIGNVLLTYQVSFSLNGYHCERGYVGPGGIGDQGKHWECTGGVHRYIDSKVFGHRHVLQRPTCHDMYATGYYDPEGLLGSLNAVVLTFFGMLAGRIWTLYRAHTTRIRRWIFWCVIFGAIAGGLCGFSQNQGVIPVNKNVWSVSFICCQACTALLVLSVFYVLIDVTNIWSGTPFLWLGSNSIIIYVGSEVLESYIPFGFAYGDTNHYKLLLSNCVGVVVWIMVAGYLYRRKIFYSL